MADEEIDKIKRLSPEERIGRLRKILEADKKEIEETENLIKKTQEEIRIEKEKEEVEVPEIEAVDITRLFEAEETLSEIVTRELPAEEASREYISEAIAAIRYEPTENIRTTTENIYQEIQQTGEVTLRQIQDIYRISQGAMEKMDDIRAGKYTPGTQATENLVITAKMAKAIKEMYKG